MNIFGWCIFLSVIAFLGFLTYMGLDINKKNNLHRKECSDRNMSSMTINKGLTVFCVDDEGRVFYLQ